MRWKVKTQINNIGKGKPIGAFNQLSDEVFYAESIFLRRNEKLIIFGNSTWE
jgi:hypothetical protein